MLRLRRQIQLMIALCVAAFLSALISLIIYRVLAMTMVSTDYVEITNGLREIQDIEPLRKIALTLVQAGVELREAGSTLALWGLGFVLIWSLILGLTAFASYRQACKVGVGSDAPVAESIIDLALAGKLALVKMFWGGYVSLLLLFWLISFAIFQFLPLFKTSDISFLTIALFAPIALAIPATIKLSCAILVWRCAANTSSVMWGYLAKLAVLTFTVIPTVWGFASLVAIL